LTITVVLLSFKGTSFTHIVVAGAVSLLHRESRRLFERSHLAHPLHEFLVVIRFCDEDVVHTKGGKRVDGRLRAVEGIGNDDEGEHRMGFPDPCKQSFPCIDLAVLLLLPVRILHLFRGERYDLPHVGLHKSRLDDLVGVSDLSPLVFFDQASRAGDPLGSEVLRTVQGDDVATVQHPVLLQVLSPLQGPEEVGEEGLDLFRIHVIHNLPHLRVLRDGFDVEERLQVVHVGLILHSPLKLEE
jgi:hypothetical protein